MIRYKFHILMMVLWGLSLTALSWASGYGIRSSVGRMSFEIATMLTPIGMARIFFNEDHWLKPYYNQKVLLGGLFENPTLSLIFLVFAIVSVGGLILLRRGLRDSR